MFSDEPLEEDLKPEDYFQHQALQEQKHYVYASWKNTNGQFAW